MADEQALLTLKEALDGFDTPHLQKLIVAAYDRWNWDTGTQADKDWFDIAEQILAERGVGTVMNTNNTNITFNMGGSGPSVPVLTMDSTGDLTLGTNQSLKLKNTNQVGIGTEHEIFDADQQGNFDLGWDLKQAIIKFMAQEVIAGSFSAPNGQNLSTILDDKIATTIRNRL